MTLISVVVAVATLSIARDVLIPITLAVLLSFLLAPLVNLLRRTGLGRVPGVVLAVLLALGVILGTAGLIGTQVADLAGDIPRYTDTIQQKVDAVQSATFGRLSAFVGSMGSQINRDSHASAGAPASAGTTVSAASAAAPTNAAAKPIPVEVHQPEPSLMKLARRVLTPILSPLMTTAIVVVVAIFILLRPEDLRDRLIRMLGTGDLHRTMTAMDEAGHRLSRYFLTLLALNTAFGSMIGLGLFVIGVPSAVLWGIMAILMRFIPYIGPWLAAALPLALAAAVDPGWSMLLWTGTLFVVSEGVMGQVIEPMAYGHSTGLSPLSVVVAAIFWSWLWGPVGLILSMPLTLCLVILGRHVDRLKFLDVLLGDRSALTPVESFYNRMLAGRLDEVQDDAEQLLKSCTLSAYYDEVAIPGLRLATIDIERGVLTEAQTIRIIAGVQGLLEEIGDHDDSDTLLSAAGPARLPSDLQATSESREPGPPAGLGEPVGLSPDWQAPSAVLCVAGRGPLDDLASAMLAQLLGKRGIGASVLTHEAVSLRAADTLDIVGVQMVCLTYSGIAGTSSDLRYTVRRLRARSPSVCILVGFWPTNMVSDDRLRAAVAADIYAGSLHDMVVACLAEALGPASVRVRQLAPVPDP
ncbi:MULTISPECIES: AI-2E family transporter [unclassified Acidiphilium]|uniref:AI-2E family transporter n=1 Tax=unclassified Acidiphilium TaxID=2617493 RepID=UPI0025B8DB06|nr:MULTISPECIES: AI-2E family transporter [unclassified Acidiphilium]HQT61466.1 AI-2E family transporter [Acidiphilium sp.]